MRQFFHSIFPQRVIKTPILFPFFAHHAPIMLPPHNLQQSLEKGGQPEGTCLTYLVRSTDQQKENYAE